MHVPQRQKQRGGASAEETTLKPEQLVSGSDEIHAVAQPLNVTKFAFNLIW